MKDKPMATYNQIVEVFRKAGIALTDEVQTAAGLMSMTFHHDDPRWTARVYRTIKAHNLDGILIVAGIDPTGTWPERQLIE